MSPDRLRFKIFMIEALLDGPRHSWRDGVIVAADDPGDSEFVYTHHHNSVHERYLEADLERLRARLHRQTNDRSHGGRTGWWHDIDAKRRT